MRRLWSGVMVAGVLVGLAACGSDDDKGSSTTVVTTAVTTVSTAATTADSTATSDSTATAESTATTADGSDVDVSALTRLQQQVVTDNLAAAAEAGVDVDEACFVKAVSGLSEADAQAIVDAGPTGDPEVSDAGKAIGQAASLCIAFPESSGGTDTTTAG